jgi:hypothetical protein
MAVVANSFCTYSFLFSVFASGVTIFGLATWIMALNDSDSPNLMADSHLESALHMHFKSLLLCCLSPENLILFDLLLWWVIPFFSIQLLLLLCYILHFDLDVYLGE